MRNFARLALGIGAAALFTDCSGLQTRSGCRAVAAAAYNTNLHPRQGYGQFAMDLCLDR